MTAFKTFVMKLGGVKKAFAQFDMEKKGFLNREDFRDVLERMAFSCDSDLLYDGLLYRGEELLLQDQSRSALHQASPYFDSRCQQYLTMAHSCNFRGLPAQCVLIVFSPSPSSFETSPLRSFLFLDQ